MQRFEKKIHKSILSKKLKLGSKFP